MAEKLTLPKPPAGMRWKVEAERGDMFSGESYTIILQVKIFGFWRHVRSGSSELNSEAARNVAESILQNHLNFEEAKKMEGIYGND